MRNSYSIKMKTDQFRYSWISLRQSDKEETGLLYSNLLADTGAMPLDSKLKI